jgi:CheY-like chemotaxis protein/signal transduction histidine kinase
MRLTIRTKLSAIVVAAALALGVLVVSAAIIATRLDLDLEAIQGRYLPKMDLGPRLAAEFEGARRGFQDAVAAHDFDAVAEARDRKTAMLGEIAAAHDLLDPAQANALSRAIDDYFGAATDVSRRLIGGETGEDLVNAMGAMQTKQGLAVELLKSATTLDRGELQQAFASISRTQASVSRARLLLSAGCLALVISLAVWLGRGVLRSLGVMEVGLRRFGQSDFSRPIDVVTDDELGDVARQANQMADSLQRLRAEGERTDWIKAGVASLTNELRGDLEPAEVATRAARLLARTLGAPAAALYVAAPDGALELVGHALSNAGAEDAITRRFAPGEGLVGQAALEDDLTVVANPPPGYLRVQSGLGAAAPRALVLVPLGRAGRVTGVLELALFEPLADAARELLRSVRETVAIALEVARARAATRELLAATQRQAERLSAQEEELRATNEELQAQEEELRQANTDLSQQTEELEAQRQMLADRNADLDEARVGLEQRAAELTTVSAYKSQFLANMSHELRTPLNSMLLLSNLLAENEDRTLSPKQVEFARTIYGAGRDLLALINQVLDLAKVESGRQEVEIEAVSPRDVAAHVERIFAPLARDKGLTFESALAPDAPDPVFTDRRRLEQIITNLIGNAIKFTSKGGVTLRVGRAPAGVTPRRPELARGGGVAFSVTDTGLGIAPENHERVFAPFEQVDAAVDRRYGGTGLGLGIAREMATLLGGELHLTSALGAGSTFTLFLPLGAPASAIASSTAGAAPRVVLAARDRPSGPTVSGEPFLLLIEDDPVFAATFGEIIQAQGLRYMRAPSGQAGLLLARELRPQGIILDVKLPDTDGWNVMEALRADPATSMIPVHFISALDGAERGLALGAVGYLTKPVTRRDLLDVIETLVPKGATRSARFLVVEDDTATANSVLRLLETEGLEAVRVSSAEEALAALRRERFGCMILDLSLPAMTGLDLLQALRDEGIAGGPKVVVYTARALSRAETMALEAYAEAVVLKDGSSAERLLDEVRLFVRRLNEAATVGAGQARTAELPPIDVRFEGRRVLVVDDDMRTVYALTATLRAKGIDVVVADTGKAALETLDRRPDLEAVLMDIMMPEMDGYEAMRRIRADGRFGALPIIALTAKAMKGDAERCVEAGASHYLPKPIDADRLLSLLATCLPREPEARPRA